MAQFQNCHFPNPQSQCQGEIFFRRLKNGGCRKKPIGFGFGRLGPKQKMLDPEKRQGRIRPGPNPIKRKNFVIFIWNQILINASKGAASSGYQLGHRGTRY